MNRLLRTFATLVTTESIAAAITTVSGSAPAHAVQVVARERPVFPGSAAVTATALSNVR